MNTYSVKFTKQAEKDFLRLDNVVKKHAAKAFMKLQADFNAGHTLSGSLGGVRSLEFSAPGGDYRAAYVVDGGDCLIFLVGSHENFYKEAERRYRSSVSLLKKRDRL
ncbi:hypothetical protein MM817_03220 [Acidibacillus sp. S0AB]|uniref:Type II toxin-antitoxin system RelE/ParE family toxin n=1 Tax=Sulfoacidibacillus ferrooxidans TaxID=2005001 RepID=A0A9X1VBC9_9BACL|nr:type II toxin-antitoxin system RelE/ParE family toxin [Sulfoacidibacillus ferrooxidans]MCI0184923.1 hypothetical protein [Sulfoacidibacillus ferrooxidans]